MQTTIDVSSRIQSIADAFLASSYGVKLYIDIPVYNKLGALKERTDQGESLTEFELAYLDHLERMPK